MVGTQVDIYASRSIGGIFLAILALSQFSGAALAADNNDAGTVDPGSAYWNPEISALAISTDGDLVAASGVDGAIHIWDAKTGALRHRLWRMATNSARRHAALPIAFQRMVRGI